MVVINEISKENDVERVVLTFQGEHCFSCLLNALFDSAELLESKGYHETAEGRMELALSLSFAYEPDID